jgi:olfactory receptor
MTIMEQEISNKISLGTLVGEFLHTVIPVSLIIQLPFCGPSEIDHYFCDIHPVLKLACTSTHIIGGVVMANSANITLGGFLSSYLSPTLLYWCL